MNNDVYVKGGEIREIRERPNVNGCTHYTTVGGGPIIVNRKRRMAERRKRVNNFSVHVQ
jgi:hypothetical protein